MPWFRATYDVKVVGSMKDTEVFEADDRRDAEWIAKRKTTDPAFIVGYINPTVVLEVRKLEEVVH
jgi:hypothetical protein